MRPIGNPSVFDLYRMPFKKKLSCYQQGLTSYQDLAGSTVKLNEKQRRQISFGLIEQGDHTEPDRIRAFLSQLSYPLYFLDFETVQPAVPQYIGTKPYDQIPFQYSLHYIEQEGGELKHTEFLAEPEDDPRRPLAEQLCADIPRDVCVTAYNKAFECTRIKELAEAFPDLADHLLNIRDNIVDLLTPFQSGWYYNRAMGGSFSIKSVLPALFPDDPALDYHNLDGIHNGSEAMNAFPMMASMEPGERAEMRKNLLRYCKLDTFAMVKVWEKLAERLECSPQFVSDMERGVVGISLATLKNLCLTLGVSSDNILFGTESETSLEALADRCRVLSKEQFAILVEIVEKYIEGVTL